MKTLLKIVTVAVFTLLPFIGSPASAASVCSVGYTGPDSNNMCTSVTTYTCRVTNTNTVDILNTNNQVVASGQVGVSGNGQGGSSTSGSVSNNNGTTFSVVITNTSQPGALGTCTATATVPATETQPPVVQPTQQGTGAAAATVLPKTSGDPILSTLAIVAGSLTVLAALGVGGVALYRYYKSL